MQSALYPDWRPQGVLIVGCGYSGVACARLLTSDGIPCIGTTQERRRFAEITASGAYPVIFQANSGSKLPSLPFPVDHAIICVGPPWDSAYDPTNDIAQVLIPLGLKAIIYLSSTSVYGDKGGEWVDEDTECTPVSPAGIRRLAAEKTLLNLWASHGFPVIITRLPGIYGPYRSLFDRIRSGRFRLIAEKDSYSNRIHVEDLALGVIAALHHGQPGRIYLLTDGDPAPLADVASYCAGLLGVSLAEALSLSQAQTELDPSRRALLMDSKRLKNDRMRQELGVTPRFGGYRQGLKAVLEAELALGPALTHHE